MKRDFSRELTVTIGINTIVLSDIHSIKLNGKKLEQLPFQASDLTIRQATSEFILIVSKDMNVAYDGNAVYITLDSVYREHVRGLCGSFDFNANNDLRLPNGQLTCDTDTFSGGYLINDTTPISPLDNDKSKFDRKKAVSRLELFFGDQWKNVDFPFRKSTAIISATRSVKLVLLWLA